MSAASIATSIAQLDEISRERKLTDKESLLLERLLKQQMNAAQLPRRHQKPSAPMLRGYPFITSSSPAGSVESPAGGGNTAQ